MPTLPPLFRSRPRQDHRQQADQRRGECEPWRRWYNLAIWRRLRAAQLRKEPLCENCLLDDGRVTAADTVHHLKPHRGDWSLFTDPANLGSVCKSCHDGEIQRGERAGWTDRAWQVEGHRIPPRVIQPIAMQPSAIPLTMVCGPPGAGKSTYIDRRKGSDDIVVDIDAILTELSGSVLRTQQRREQYLLDAFMERNRRLSALSLETRPIKAWFIIGAPHPSTREAWAQQLRPEAVVVMATPLRVCCDRIRGQDTRAPTAQGMIAGVNAWWDRYERSPIDTETIQ
jgi:5-methylcytosine-specific restriction endonuclease McrA